MSAKLWEPTAELRPTVLMLLEALPSSRKTGTLGVTRMVIT